MEITTVRFWARDMSGQKRKQITAPSAVRIGDYVGPVLEELRLPTQDSRGQQLSYRWRNHTKNVLLGPSESIGSAIAEDDEVMLMGEPVAG